ncbi:MAG: hypothetical protein JWQ49_4329 [Edaphobacter sp.]|nr:hypothetical protein [Edaphobacter sp.]
MTSAMPQDLEEVRLSAWERILCWFFCCDPAHVELVPRHHWRSHSRLGMFVAFAVLPIAGLSWAHLAKLLAGPGHGEYWADLFGVFMMIVTVLMDSMLCCSLAQRRLTKSTLAVGAFRWVFAICVASSNGMAIALLVMGDQLARERATQALQMRESDIARVRELHDLPRLEQMSEAANSRVVEANRLLGTVPPAVETLRARYDSCMSGLTRLREENSRRLPALVGERSKLRTEISGLQEAGTDTSRQRVAAALGRVNVIETEIREFSGRVGRKDKECGAYQRRAAEEQSAHTQHAQTLVKAAERERSRAEHQRRENQLVANVEIVGLEAVTREAFSENLSAQLKATWALITRDWWALMTLYLAFIVSIVIELSPMLGKIALRGGSLDQLGHQEEEAIRQRILTHVEGLQVQGEIERAVLAEHKASLVEIAAIRKAAESTLESLETLRNRKERAGQFPDVRGSAEAVFLAAQNQIREIFVNSVHSTR